MIAHPRLAYHLDGSVGKATASPLTQVQLETLNKDIYAGTPLLPYNQYLGVVFASPLTLRGWCAFHGQGNYISNVGYTTDASVPSLGSGTWTVLEATLSPNSSDWYSAIREVNIPNVTAIRFYEGNMDYPPTLHVYGEYASVTNRLRFVRPTSIDALSGDFFHLGTVQPTAVRYREFRVHNPTTQIAQAPVVSAEALNDTTPAVDSAIMFSTDMATWTSTLTLADIPAGGTSPIVFMRLIMPAVAAGTKASIGLKAKQALFV